MRILRWQQLKWRSVAKMNLGNLRCLQSSKWGYASNGSLAARTVCTGNSTNCSIIESDLNLPYSDWNINAGWNNGNKSFTNSLVWENGFTETVDSQLEGIHFVLSEIPFTASGTLQGISDHSFRVWNVCLFAITTMVAQKHVNIAVNIQRLSSVSFVMCSGKIRNGLIVHW